MKYVRELIEKLVQNIKGQNFNGIADLFTNPFIIIKKNKFIISKYEIVPFFTKVFDNCDIVDYEFLKKEALNNSSLATISFKLKSIQGKVHSFLMDMIFSNNDNETLIKFIGIIDDKINDHNLINKIDYNVLNIVENRTEILKSLYFELADEQTKLNALFKLLKVSQFEFDPLRNKFNFINNRWDKIINEDNPKTYDKLVYQLLSRVYSYDFDNLRDSLSNENIKRLMNDDISQIYVEFRIMNNFDTFVWLCIEMSKFIKIDGRQEIIGYIRDIESFKQKELAVLDNANRDSLTNFYNKGYTKVAIEQAITSEKDKKHALVFFDIDDFKYVNDMMGHPLGDLIIEYFSKNVFETFRSSDIFGRVGGDEFVIFIKDVPSKKMITNKLEIIADKFSSLNHENYDFTTLSCSIGIAEYPKDGTTFDELLEKADKAMYVSKAKGKNKFTFCSETYNIENDKKIEVNFNDYNSNFTFFENAFNIFYNSNNEQEAVLKIINIIGNKLSINRILINTFNNDKYEPVYQWFYNHFSNPLTFDKNDIENLHQLSNYNQFYFSNDIKAMDEDVKNILLNYNISSIFQYFFIKNDKIIGVLTCDSIKKHIWLKQEIYNLIMISRLIEFKLF